MKKLSEKILKCLLAVTMIFGIATATIASSGLTISAIDGVEELVENVTTLEEAFPDEVFRAWIYNNVLITNSAISTPYTDTDKGHVLTDEDIGDIAAHLEISIIGASDTLDGKIESLVGIQHFIGLKKLILDRQKITEIDLSQNVQLTYLRLIGNFIEEIDVSMLTNLAYFNVRGNFLTNIDVSNNTSLEEFHVLLNPITGAIDLSANDNLVVVNVGNTNVEKLILSSTAKSNIRMLYTYNSKIENFDLSGFNSLGTGGTYIAYGTTFINMTPTILANGTFFGLSGNRGLKDGYILFRGPAGFITVDAYGNYIIAAGLGISYQWQLKGDYSAHPYGHAELPHFDSMKVRLTVGGIVDSSGALVVGNDYSVDTDGTIILSDGGTIVAVEGSKYEFTGYTTLKNGVITTGDSYTVNTVKQLPALSDGTIPVPDMNGMDSTVTMPSNETSVINTYGGESSVPSGTIVTQNDETKIVVVGDAVIDSEGNVISKNIWLEAPDVDDVVVDPDTGAITLPDGGIIHYPNGDSETVIGEIVVTPPNTVEYSDAELLSRINDAIASLNINSTVVEFVAIQDLVDAIKDAGNKATGQAALDAAKVQLITDLLAEIYVDLAADLESVTVEDYAIVQDLIHSLSTKTVKDGLQTSLDEARRDQIIGLIDTLDSNPLLAGLDRDEDGNIIGSPEAVDIMKDDTVLGKLNDIEKLTATMQWSDEKRVAVDYFREKFGNVYYFVIQGFLVYTGQLTFVLAQISTPYDRFTEVYFGDVTEDPNAVLLTRSYDGGVTGDYIAYEGSTFIILTRSYLEKLSNGTYTISVLFGDANVTLNLVVAKPTITSPSIPHDVPNTGVANGILPWLGLAVVSAGTSTFFAKKKDEEIERVINN